MKAVTEIPQGGTGDVKYHHGAQGAYETARAAARSTVNLESEPEPPRVRRPGRRSAPRAPRRPSRDGPARRTTTRAPRCPSSSTATPPSPARASSPRRSTCRRSTATRSAARCTSSQNNQIGFTTDSEDSRSTHYASDLAQGLRRPDHPRERRRRRGVHQRRAARDGLPRASSATTSLIDLIGYRRFGHNEADEPAYTQPEMYAADQGATSAVSEALRRAARSTTASSTKEEVERLAAGDLGRADARCTRS